MRLTRIAAVLCFTLGIASWQAAMESSCQAVDCSESLFSPATCSPAYEDSNVNGSTNLQCVWGEGESCTPGTGSSCGSDLGFGRAFAGKCKLQPLGSDPYQCFDETAVTTITLHSWTSYCTDINGTCGCTVTIDDEGDTNNVEVCECRDELI